MKRFSLFFLMVIFLLLGSCVTGTRRGSFADYPGPPFFYDCRINSVSLTVDHVREDNIASQLFMICQTYLESKQRYDPIRADKTLLLDIRVEQRSFMHDVDLYNAIYVSCVIQDEGGRIYGKENEYISGKRTMISSAEQDRIMGRILDRILKKQKSQYRAMLKYRKKNEK
ncbi:hypothetical protein AGMMS50268_00160 [Spirochaetia bacterium]|nr:hypothetical protein AGMMS50268_00160 [Spirochaetia bacterium]